MKTKGSIWKTGTKDTSVYFELWSGDDTRKIVDGDLSPEQAYKIGKSLMDNAIKQGFKPSDAGSGFGERQGETT